MIGNIGTRSFMDHLLLTLSRERAGGMRIVAASDANVMSKKVAHYICDGTDDQVEINQAFADVEDDKGTVFLTEGTFSVGVASDSTRLSGTGGYDTDAGGGVKLDVGATDHGSFTRGDMILVRGGDDGSGNTLEDNELDGLFYVGVTVSGTLAATEINIPETFADTTYTGVTWVRPNWCIRVPKGCRLMGQGLIKTIIQLQDDENAAVVKCDNDGFTSSGVQEFHSLSIRGNRDNQTGDWWECIGLFTSNSFDVHIRDCEIRYHKGYGLVVGEGWGFRLRGGWIENCHVNVFAEGEAIFEGTKIIDASDNVAGGSNIVLYNGSGLIANSEVWASNADADSTIKFRTANLTRVTGCFLRASASTPIFKIAKHGGGGYNTKNYLLTENVYYLGASSSVLLDNQNNYVYGMKITGIVWDAPDDLMTGIVAWVRGFDVELSGGSLSQNTKEPWMHRRTVGVTNNTGGSMTARFAYVWDTGGTVTDVRLPAASADTGKFAGINEENTWADGSAGYLIESGWCKVEADATAAIVIGDMLSMDGSNWGRLKKAASGEIVVAKALEALASGQDEIAAYVLTPRTLQA